MPKEILVDCVGVDNLNHYRRPHQNATICGKTYFKKHDNKERYWCYECDFYGDDCNETSIS